MKNNLDFQYLSNNERKIFSIILSHSDEKKILSFNFNICDEEKKKDILSSHLIFSNKKDILDSITLPRWKKKKDILDSMILSFVLILITFNEIKERFVISFSHRF